MINKICKVLGISFGQCIGCTALFLLGFPNSGIAATEDELQELLDEPLAELGRINVTSVSKTEEDSFRSAAAIHVITNEDIRRSGATTIPELLRQVPGISVAQASANKWAVSSRGFNDTLSNKLLILIDGRSVYTPQFSGVFWDAQDTLFEDIDRIEIIRGPGATLWGANAVNGIINVITKKSTETAGSYVSAGYGNKERGFLEARHGEKSEGGWAYRAYSKVFNRDSETDLHDNDLKNNWKFSRAGFRGDHQKQSIGSLLTIQGDIYTGEEDLTLYLPMHSDPYVKEIPDTGDIGGGNLLGRWSFTNNAGHKNTFQAYVDKSSRHFANIEIDISQTDFDFQQEIIVNKKSQLIWGSGYRHVWDSFNGSDYFSYESSSATEDLYSIFLENKYYIIDDKLLITTGAKYEVNDYTGGELQPNLRLAWYPSNTETVWGSVSRAVRTPSRSENDINLVVGAIKDRGFIRWLGNNDITSEKLTAYELGYRILPRSNLSFDIASFFNIYDSIRTTEPGSSFGDTALPLYFSNKATGKSKGFEVSSTWKAGNDWELYGSYSFIDIDIDPEISSRDGVIQRDEGKTPNHQFNVSSRLDLPHNIEFDNTLYFVDELTTGNIPSYFRLNSRLAWHVVPGIELAAYGQNLLDDKTQEFTRALNEPDSEIGRSFYLKLSSKF